MTRVGILGAAESGVGAALLAREKQLDVFVSDIGIINSTYKDELTNNKISFEEGRHTFEKLRNSDVIVKSPGISDSTSIIRQLKGERIPIISEIEFAFKFFPGKIIAITGSNGKTTTTNLTYHILQSTNRNVLKAGNVGSSFAKAIIHDEYDVAVLEVSSFQLEGMIKFKPDIAVLLNITPDHLDRYSSFEEYVDAKWSIGRNQTNDNYFICSDQEVIMTKWQSQPHKSRILVVREELQASGRIRLDDVILFENPQLLGPHNAVNAACAVATARLMGVNDDDIVKAISTFQNDPHRMETFATHRGVQVVDDSKATNLDATEKALSSFDRPIIWVVGGVDKGNDYKSIISLVHRQVRAILCLGKDNEKIKNAFGHLPMAIFEFQDVNKLVEKGFSLAQKGDVILLSPACASFDLFENYKDRGNQFKSSVKKYIDGS